jgi:transmembrane sensor
MITEMNYASFKVEEFCKDTDFIRWVISPTEESNQFWNSFIAAHPNKSKEINIATEYIKTFHFQEFEPTINDLTNLKKRILEEIESPLVVVNWWSRPAYWATAAVILMVFSFGIFLWNQKPTSYQTAYGEVQKISLPDGSIVTLNANSTLKLAPNMKNEAMREVWLDGEAYFDIEKLNGVKFIVHTREAQVEVLGTEFNVSTRRKQTKVILHEGKVKLHTSNAQPILMKPGDMATVSEKSEPIQLKMVQPDQYDVWRESVVVLDDRTISEIVEMMEDTYGIAMQFENPRLLNKKLSGKLSLKSTDDFIENLSTILDVEVEKTEKGYVFK